MRAWAWFGQSVLRQPAMAMDGQGWHGQDLGMVLEGLGSWPGAIEVDPMGLGMVLGQGQELELDPAADGPGDGPARASPDVQHLA